VHQSTKELDINLFYEFYGRSLLIYFNLSAKPNRNTTIPKTMIIYCVLIVYYFVLLINGDSVQDLLNQIEERVTIGQSAAEHAEKLRGKKMLLVGSWGYHFFIIVFLLSFNLIKSNYLYSYIFFL
jgi:hypothetical protein